MSCSKGLYVQRLRSGQIHSVQVRDSAGNDRPVDPEVYISRAYKPAMETLPDVSDYTAALQSISDFTSKHAASLKLSDAGKIMVARVTVGDETLIVKVGNVTDALFDLAGSPHPGLRINADIELVAMTVAEFAALTEHQ